MSRPKQITFKVDKDNFDSIQELLNFLEKSNVIDSDIPLDEENPGPFGGLLLNEKKYYQELHSMDTFYFYLELLQKETGERLRCWSAATDTSAICGYYFESFIATEEYFSEVCKMLKLSYDEENYQIYLINKELMNGN